jgi:hypothetical protein
LGPSDGAIFYAPIAPQKCLVPLVPVKYFLEEYLKILKEKVTGSLIRSFNFLPLYGEMN